MAESQKGKKQKDKFEKTEEDEKTKEEERLVDILKRITLRLEEIKNKKKRDEEDKKDEIEKNVLNSLELNNEIFPKNKSDDIELNLKNILGSFFLLFINTTLYIAGSFILVSLKNSFWSLFVSSIKCYFDILCDKDEFIERSNFFDYFNEQFLREPINLNLIMLWNFLGFKFSNSCGFIFSAFILMIINAVIFLLTYSINYNEYNQNSCKYIFPKIILLFINWVLMSICFGASSLLAQQQFFIYFPNCQCLRDIDETVTNTVNESVDSTINIQSDNDINKGENKNKTNLLRKLVDRHFLPLFFFSLSTFFGFCIKLGIGYGFYSYKRNRIIVYNDTILKNNSDVLNITNNINFTQNYFFINNTNITYNYKLNRNIFIYFWLVYITCILISIFLFYLLKCYFFKQEKKDENSSGLTWKTECEIFGCKIYSERITLEKNYHLECCYCCNCCKCCECCEYCNCSQCCQCCKICLCWILICELFNHYCKELICNMFNCRKDESKNFCNCCIEYDKNDFEKHKQFFCYCFQEKSFFYWINTFCINVKQKKIVFGMILYFLSRLVIIGCEKSYEYNLKNDNILDEISPILQSLTIIFFVFITIINSPHFLKFLCLIILRKFRNCKPFNSLYIIIDKLGVTLFGLIIIFVFNIEFGFSYSFRILIRGFKDIIFETDEKINERLTLYTSVLINSFFVHSLNYYCLVIAETKNLEILFSQSTLLTIYLIIINFSISLIKYLFKNISNLYILQLTISGIFEILFIIVIFRWIYFIFVYMYCPDNYDKGICTCEICCCNKKSKFYNQNYYEICSKCDCKILCCVNYFAKIYHCIKGSNI